MIALVFLVAGLLLLGFDAADFTLTGLSALAVLLIVVGLWLGGAFSSRAWVADDATSARLSAVDEEVGR